MNVLIPPLTAVMFLATGYGAVAETSAGVVTGFSSSPHALTLRDGESFLIPSDVRVDGISSGQFVTVTWSSMGGDHVATRVVPAHTERGN
jgi:hypothetical protein